MTDRNKFEEMLERLVNEDRAGAEELFHEIVVEKSREIYQNIIESEDQEDDDKEEEEVEESTDEEDESLDESEEDDLDEMFGLEEFELEADAAPMMGGDATDDMISNVDVDMPGMDDEESVEGSVDDRVTDLEDALDALRAEFEALMSDEEGEEADDDMDMGDEEEADDEEEEEADDDEEPKESFAPQFENKSKKNATEQMREYVEKVTPKMGDNGANTKSTVAGKNDMGGTTANIAKGGTANEKGTAGGLANNKPQVMNTKNVNVVGAKGATKMSSQPGHGAEKKGKPETAANTKSIIGK
jgi:hypothetical protein